MAPSHDIVIIKGKVLVMTREEILDQAIYDEGIIVITCHFESVHGAYYRDARGAVIGVNTDLSTSAERFYVKAHELGHHNLTSINTVSAQEEAMNREEARVRRWEIEYLMPVDSLIEAFQKGYTTPLDLADFLEITPEKLAEGIGLYYQIYGPQSIHGQYVVTWNPFNIKRDRRRKDV